MPQKSRRVASRQAAASKERKRKKKSRAQTLQRQVKPAGVPTAQPPVAPESPSAPLPQPPKVRQAAPRYQYVTSELRRIAILAGAMILILVVLAFVLG
jgi:hypothetical protein